MKILVTGSSGMVGSAVVAQLTAGGHYVVRLVRNTPDKSRDDIFWDPVSAKIERAKLEKLDAVVHLAGESIYGIWTAAKKERIHKSRVAATEFLCETLAGLTAKPKTFVCASGVGIYGSRGEEWLQETSPTGSGFLATLCQEWETAAATAQNAGVRVIRARIGMALSLKGGALQKMLPCFKLGIGGPAGNGRQYISWICASDLARIILFVIENKNISGPVNCVAPEPVTNGEFAKTLGRVLGRPAFLPMPGFLFNTLTNGMAGETLLASQRCQPAKLLQSGFKFEYADIEHALRHLIGGAL